MKKFAYDNLVNALMTGITGVLNWIFAFMLTRILSDSEVSSFNAFTSLLIIISIPSTWLTLLTSTSGKSAERWLTQTLKKKKSVLFIVATLAILVFVLSLISRLQPIHFVLINVLFYSGIYAALLKGQYQYMLSFTKLALIGIGESSLKLIILGLFYFLNYPYLGTYVAFISVSIASVLILKSWGDFKEEKDSIRDVNLIHTFMYAFNIMFFTNIDIVMSRILLSDVESSLYVSALQLVKLVFFGSSAVLNVLLPNIAKAKDRSDKKKMVIFVMVTFTLVGIAVNLAVSLFYTKISALFDIASISRFNLIVFLSGVILFILSQVFQILLMVKKSNYMVTLVACVTLVQIGLYLLFGKTVESFIRLYSLVALLTFIISGVMYKMSLRNNFLQKEQ